MGNPGPIHWNGGLRLLSSEDTVANVLAILQVVRDPRASRQRLDELLAERKAADATLAKAQSILAEARAVEKRNAADRAEIEEQRAALDQKIEKFNAFKAEMAGFVDSCSTDVSRS